MNHKIIKIDNSNSQNLKLHSFKSKTPFLISNTIKIINNIPRKSNKDENPLINNNNNNLNRNIIFILKSNKREKAQTKKKNNNDNYYLINNNGKYLNFNNKNNSVNNNLNREIICKTENNKEKDLLKKENNQKPEDITDYINIDEKEYNDKYLVKERKVTNEAIEEVEEAKEMSELKQNSEKASPISNSKNAKSFIRNALYTKDNIIKTENNNNMKYQNIDLKKKCDKIPKNKKEEKGINISLPLKSIYIGFPRKNKSKISIQKNSDKLNERVTKSYNNKKNKERILITKQINYSPKLLDKKDKNYIITKRSPQRSQNNSKTGIKKIVINRRNHNKINLSLKNKSKLNLRNDTDGTKTLKTYNNLEGNSKNEKSNKMTPNLKNIFKNRKLMGDDIFISNNRSGIHKGILKENKSKNINVPIYNNKIRFLSPDQKKNEKISKRIFSMKYKNKNSVSSEDKDKKLNKMNDIKNNSYFSYLSIDRIKTKIKNSEEKYHKLFNDYFSKYHKNKNRNYIKHSLLDGGEKSSEKFN